MVQTSILVFLGTLLPLARADGGSWGPGWGPGHGPGHGPGGGPWSTGAPAPAPAPEACQARAACDSASAAVQSCSSRAGAAVTVNFSAISSCMCQPGPSAAVQDCFSGCFGATIWPGGPAQCTAAATSNPVITPTTRSTAPILTGTVIGTGSLTSRLSSVVPTGSVPLSSRTGTGVIPGPSGNGTVVPSRTSSGSGGPSLPATTSPARSGAEVRMASPMIAVVVSLALAAGLVLV